MSKRVTEHLLAFAVTSQNFCICTLLILYLLLSCTYMQLKLMLNLISDIGTLRIMNCIL